MKHRYRVLSALDKAGGWQQGTVTIDRNSGSFEVRPLRRRRVYAMPLAVVADMVCRTLIVAELREKQKAKKRGRKRRV